MAEAKGILGRKLGMTQIFTEDSRAVPVTVIQAGPCVVTKVNIFQPGEHTDVVGVSKGKGFAGTMKRHGFAGLGASHGTERKHRSPGAIGACATPSRVFRGTRMAGQMRSERVTVLNLEVVGADPERNLLLLKGAVPGPTGALVMVRSSVKNPVRKGT